MVPQRDVTTRSWKLELVQETNIDKGADNY